MPTRLLYLLLALPLIVHALPPNADAPPFVTTPPDAIARMLELAAPQPDETLADLGSGDGRIVIEAARRYGIQAVGFEMDESLVRISRMNAKKAGVLQHTRFEVEDIFDVDLSGVQVVTMFLRDSINLRLRPKLCKELPAGARVVTYRYAMGEWQPRHAEELHGERIMLWRVPEDLGCS